MIKYLLPLIFFYAFPLVADVNDQPAKVRVKIPVVALHDEAPKISLFQEAVPRWVALLSVPNGAVPDPTADAQLLLIDKQINVDNQTTYYHLAKRVISPEAIRQHSLIELPFDPAFQEVTLHSLCLHRLGARLDRVSVDDFHLVLPSEERDEPKERRWSLMTLLDDVREGDIIEYSYSIHGQNPAYMGRIIDECVFRYPHPVERIYYRAIGLNPCCLSAKEHNTRLQPTRHSLGPDGWEWVWNAISVPGFKPETNQPIWFHDTAWIQISEFNEWVDVSRWGHRLFMQRTTPGAAATALTKRWMEQFPSDHDRALAALRFVQDEIALIDDPAEELHFPRNSEVILELRAGKSSDKASLLKVLLRLMNIESTPAAVSNTNRQTVTEWHPSPAPFDHVILQAKIDNTTYWMDPGARDQGGDLHQHFCSKYQRTLLLDGSSHEFTCLGMPLALPEITATTTYYLWPDKLDSSIFVETVIRGETANRLRGQIREHGADAISQAIGEPYLHTHGATSRVSPTEIVDNRALNTITVKAHYRAKNIWQLGESGRRKFLTVRPFHSTLEQPQVEGKRRTLLAIDYPFHVVETVHIVAPEYHWPEKPVLVKHFLSHALDSYVTFSSHGDTLTMESEVKVLVDSLAPKDVKGHQELIKQVQDALVLRADMPTSYHHPWDISYPFIVNSYLLLIFCFLAIDPSITKRR